MNDCNSFNGFVIYMEHVLALWATFNVIWLATHADFHLLAVTGTEPYSGYCCLHAHTWWPWCKIVNIFRRYKVITSWRRQYSEEYIGDFCNLGWWTDDTVVIDCYLKCIVENNPYWHSSHAQRTCWMFCCVAESLHVRYKTSDFSSRFEYIWWL